MYRYDINYQTIGNNFQRWLPLQGKVCSPELSKQHSDTLTKCLVLHRHRSPNLILQKDSNFNVQICAAGQCNPVNTRRRTHAGLMTTRRGWFRPSIKSSLGQRLVFTRNTYTASKWKWTTERANACRCTCAAQICVLAGLLGNTGQSTFRPLKWLFASLIFRYLVITIVY